MTQAEPGTTKRVRTGLTLTLGVVTGVLGLVGNSIAALVAKTSGPYAWLAVPVAAVGVAIIAAFATAHTESAWPESNDDTATDVTLPIPEPQRRGLRLTTAILTALLVLGGGGLAVTWGTRYAVGVFTGSEPGVDRLATPVSTTSKGLGLAVEKFEDTPHYTRLTVTVSNNVGNPLSLPLLGNCVVVGDDGTTIEADSFRSHWSESVAPGSRQTGTIIFGSHLPVGVAKASLAFATVFEQGFDGPKSIRVDGLSLRPQ